MAGCDMQLRLKLIIPFRNIAESICMTLEMGIEGRVGGSGVIALTSIVRTENEPSTRLSVAEE